MSTTFKLIVAFVFNLFIVSELFAQTFTKISSGPVVNTIGDSRSVNWIDVNNDGWIDLMITNGPFGGQNNFLYLNDSIGGFAAVANDTIVHDNAPSDGATFADTDNDGDLDCYVANWYQTNNLFYTNNGTGSFTREQGLVTTSGGFCETASWGDYDNDGLVDLYVTNSGGINKNLLYHNDGNNTFSKITVGSMVNDISDSRSVNWTDIDGDGDLDLFVTNENTQSENTYRNDGAGVFTKITTGALAANVGHTMSSSWGDYDNDGDLDVFLARDASSNALYRNDGNFNFTKIINDTVSNTNAHSFSSAWSDIDNDGDIDLFVTNSFFTILKQLNFLYLNNGNGSFTRVSNTVPATDSSWSYGCAFGDYDNDGFEDLAVATVRFNSVDPADFLYHNDGNSNNWVTIKLIGTTTNKSAIGTKIRLKATINGAPVWQLREISAQTSYCSQNDLRAHFGLGNATIIDSIQVEWLGDTVETFTNISINHFISIVQGQGVLGIKKTEFENNILVYPNPAANTLLVKFDKDLIKGSVNYEITDVHGGIVASGIINNSSINIRHLNPGNYFIYFNVPSGIISRHFVKQ